MSTSVPDVGGKVPDVSGSAPAVEVSAPAVDAKVDIKADVPEAGSVDVKTPKKGLLGRFGLGKGKAEVSC